VEGGLDGGGGELHGLRVDDDVPAEQHAAGDLSGVPGCVLRADGDGAGTGGIGHCCHPGVDTSMLVQMKLEAQKSVRPLGNRQRPFGRAAW